MADPESERRHEPRTPTSFLAAELRDGELYYRLVRDISPGGFAFDDHFPLEQPGDCVCMEFPLPGSSEPVRVRGEVIYARPGRGVGVRIVEVERSGYERFMTVPPPPVDR